MGDDPQAGDNASLGGAIDHPERGLRGGGRREMVEIFRAANTSNVVNTMSRRRKAVDFARAREEQCGKWLVGAHPD